MRRALIIALAFFILHSSFFIPIAYAAPVYPADPDSGREQWYLQRIDAYEAWGKTHDSHAVVVAVIDTGVDLNHPDLAQNIWVNAKETVDGIDNDGNGFIDDIRGWDFLSGDNDASPDISEKEIRVQALHHGTLVAGIIGAVGGNGIGGVGLNWNVKIMPLRALDSRGRGNVTTVIEAVQYAVQNGAHIINLSFVGPGFDKDLFVALQDAMRRGVLTVGAVGNTENNHGANLDQTPLYPVCYSGTEGEDVIVGVAAVDKDDIKSTFSNFGANCVDISAPGVDIWGPQYYDPARGFLNLFQGGVAGSSMATPMVTGAAALIKAFNPSYNAQEIRNILVKSADSIDDKQPSEFKGKLGSGRLNVRRALELASAGGSAVFGSSQGIPYLTVAPGSKGAPEVQVLFASGAASRSFLAYGTNFRGGIELASGDVNGDKVTEIITGAGVGGGPHVRVFAPDGTVLASFFAYDKKFRGGVKVAAGDLDGDGRAEIVTGAGIGGGPHIRIFKSNGAEVGGFFAYDKKFRGGVKVAVGDLDGDGRAEIVTSPGPGKGSGGNAVKVFDSRGRLLRSFATFPVSFQGGVNLAVGDIDGEGAPEIIVAPQGSASPEVRVYSAQGGWQRAFLVYPDVFLGGVNLALGDLDRDGKAEIIVGPGAGGGPHVKILDGFGQLKNQLFPYATNFRGGVNVGIIKL